MRRLSEELSEVLCLKVSLVVVVVGRYILIVERRKIDLGHELVGKVQC